MKSRANGLAKLYGEPPRGGQRGDHHSVKSWLRRSSQGRRSAPGPRDGRASGWLVWTGGLAAGSGLGWDPGCCGRAYCRGSAAARPAPKVVGFHRGGPMGKPGHHCLPPPLLAASTACGQYGLRSPRVAASTACGWSEASPPWLLQLLPPVLGFPPGGRGISACAEPTPGAPEWGPVCGRRFNRGEEATPAAAAPLAPSAPVDLGSASGPCPG